MGIKAKKLEGFVLPITGTRGPQEEKSVARVRGSFHSFSEDGWESVGTDMRSASRQGECDGTVSVRAWRQMGCRAEVKWGFGHICLFLLWLEFHYKELAQDYR